MILFDEDQLLLYCIRNGTSDELTDRLRPILENSLNWDYIVEKARRHGLGPLLFYNLRNVSINSVVPSLVMKKLEAIYYGNARRNLRMLNELTMLFHSFKDAGIETMLIKGLAISEILHKNISLRPISDIDLLIKEDDFKRLRKLLQKHGYTSTPSLPDLNGFEGVQYAHCFDQIKFSKKDQTHLDIHFRLLNMGYPRSDDRQVWKRAMQVKIADFEAFVPSPEDMLLHLCYHANYHRFRQLRYFHDISEVIKIFGDEIDWASVLRTARERRFETSLYYTLYFTNELLIPPVPANVLQKLQPHYLRGKLFEVVWKKNKVLQCTHEPKFNNLEGPLYYILEVDNLREKLTFLLKCLFPPLQWIASHYSQPPSSKLYVRYLLELFNRGVEILYPSKK